MPVACDVHKFRFWPKGSIAGATDEDWRFMSNLIKVKSDGHYGEQNPWIVQFRAQYYF
jgi:hypothetical protein